MKLFLTILLLTASAAGGGWWYYQLLQGKSEIRYLTTSVERATITKYVTATGTLNPVINVEVGSQISGNIKELYVDFNSDVKEGQVIALLDPAVYKAVVAQQEGEVAIATASLELAKQNAKRKQELFERNATSKADLDNAIAELAQAEAQLIVRQANLEKAKVDLSRCTIYSPINGTVITRNVDVGQTVAASMSAPVLFTIANDLTKMQINAAVAEMDVGMVQEGQDVEFEVDAFPYDTFHGKVTQVRNAATTVNNVVTYDVIIAVENNELKLKPGMTADVKIIVAQAKDVPTVPNAALRYRPPVFDSNESQGSGFSSNRSSNGPRSSSNSGSGPQRSRSSRDDSPDSKSSDTPFPRQTQSVYLLKDNTAIPHSIQTGISDGINTAVLEGLEENTEVITSHTGGPTRTFDQSSNPFGGGGMRRRF